jgi:hypothetical protein
MGQRYHAREYMCLNLQENVTFAPFGICNVVSLKGTLVENIMRRFKGECSHLASTSGSFTHTTVQVPNSALTHTKQITVCLEHARRIRELSECE